MHYAALLDPFAEVHQNIWDELASFVDLFAKFACQANQAECIPSVQEVLDKCPESFLLKADFNTSCNKQFLILLLSWIVLSDDLLLAHSQAWFFGAPECASFQLKFVACVAVHWQFTIRTQRQLDVYIHGKTSVVHNNLWGSHVIQI